MKTALFAWELGAHLGHAVPLFRIAQGVEAAGYRAVFAFKDVVFSRRGLGQSKIPLFQAPVWPKEYALKSRPFSGAGFGDILAKCGFAQEEDLGALVQAWDELFHHVRPDLVVADYAPTVCLAAYGTIPLAVVGTGFTVPPADRPTFPPLREDQPPLMAESRLLDNVAAVQRRRGRPVPPTLPALFAAPLRVVGCFPELDPYRAVRREPVAGPLEPLPEPSPLPPERRVFGYLDADHESTDELVQAVVDYGAPGEFYLRGDSAALAKFLALRGLVVHEQPPPLPEAMMRARAVLSHAGSGTSHAALAAGRPQLLLTRHHEAELTATALERLGVAVRLSGDADRDALKEGLRSVLEDGALADRAIYWSRVVADRPRLDALALTVEACVKLLG